MVKGNFKISTWIAVPEMLLCFAPLTLGWFDALGALSAMTARHETGASGLIAVVTAIILATVGPAGLVCAFRLLILRRTIRSGWLRAALIAGPITTGVLLLAQGISSRSLTLGDAFNFWSGIVLLSALPALAAIHLVRLSTDCSEGKGGLPAAAG